MPVTETLGKHSGTRTIINGATAPTAAPTGDADRIATRQYGQARLYVSWTGTVTALTMRTHYYDGGVWYRGEDANPTLANGNQRLTISPGKYAEVAVQVVTLTGTTPAVTVKIDGV